jgi:hypothetical protein
MPNLYIPPQQEPQDVRENYFEVTKASSGQVIAAAFEQALYENPLNAATRMGEYAASKGRGRKLSQSEWQQSEYFREGLTVSENGIRETTASILAERYDERRARRLVLERSPGGIGLGAAQFGAGLVASAMDPLNVAASFIPVMGQARYLAATAKYGKTVARASKGITEGAVGAVAVEQLVYSAARLEQDKDYTFADTFMNVAFGSVLGGGLHVVGGKISDGLKKARPGTVKALQQNAISKIVQDQEVNQNLAVRQDPALRNDPAFRDVTEVRQGQADLPAMPPKKGNAYPEGLRIAYGREKPPQTIRQFIRSLGGLKGEDADAPTMFERSGKDSTLFKAKKGKQKLSIDKAREAAEEAGYLPEGSTVDDLVELVARDTKETPVYSARDVDFEVRLESAKARREELERYQIDPRGYTDEQIEQILEQRRRADEMPEGIADEMTEDEFNAQREQEHANLGTPLTVKDFEARMDEADEVAARFDEDELTKLQKENELLEEDIRFMVEDERVPAEVQAEIEVYNRLERKAEEGYDAALKAAEFCVKGSF